MKKPDELIDQRHSASFPADAKQARYVLTIDGLETAPLAIEIAEGRLFASFVGIEKDLDHVVRCCNRILTTEGIEPDLRLALYDSAVIRFRRCFAKGLRAGLRSTHLGSLTSNEQKTQKYFYSMGDKFVAHSVNAAECAAPAVFLHPKTGDVHGCGALHMQMNGDNNDRLLELAQLAVKLRDEIVGPLKAASITGFEDSIHRLSKEQISQLKPLVFPINIEGDEIGKNRRI